MKAMKSQQIKMYSYNELRTAVRKAVKGIIDLAVITLLWTLHDVFNLDKEKMYEAVDFFYEKMRYFSDGDIKPSDAAKMLKDECDITVDFDEEILK